MRTRVYDYRSKKIIPDETVYQVQSQLHSHPKNAPRYSLDPVIRAFGQLDDDTVEVLLISDDFVHSSIAAPNRLVISRSKRLK